MPRDPVYKGSHIKGDSVRLHLSVWVMAVTLAGCAGSAPDTAGPAPEPDTQVVSPLASLPQVTDLPADYHLAVELANRGVFYTAGGQPAVRVDDGDHYHGYDGPGVWATEPKGTRTQGVLYGVEDGAIVSAGYLIRQSDLVAGKSFHGLTLRQLDFPAARAMTVDLVDGEPEDSNQFLILWHFTPPESSNTPMLPVGQLPSLTSLPEGFEVFACDDYPEAFCPGMGRHYTDPSSVGRLPDAEGDEGVIYGEAAGKLIFIEYVFTQEELAAGVSWPAMPLDGLAIPPIDNVHMLHFGRPGSTEGRYTVHMYFLPEDTYLAWKTEPDTL